MTSTDFTRQAPITGSRRDAYPDLRAPFGGHAVSGSKRDLRVTKVNRLRGDRTGTHRAADVTTGTGTVTGRQASLSADRKRTALMYAIG